ncbi:MAG: DUF2934 domain-containing protein [Chitinispirillaceae bacterium]|jgi:hypothetical protein
MQQVNSKPKTFSPPLERFKAEIEKRAKEIFLKRQQTKEHGDALSDWLQAEREIKGKYRIS